MTAQNSKKEQLAPPDAQPQTPSQDKKTHPYMSSVWGLELVDSSESLQGSCAVIVDILAASTNMCRLVSSGAQEVFLVNDQSIILALARYPDAVVIGDISHLKLPERITRFSNVPSALEDSHAFEMIAGKTVLYRTTNGTAMVEEALRRGAKRVLVASFTNLSAVKEFIHAEAKPVVIIKSGERTFGANWKTGEDLYCAQTLEQMLRAEPVDWEAVTRNVTQSVRGQYWQNYHDAGLTIEHLERDLRIVLRLNSCDYVPVCIKGEQGEIRVIDGKLLKAS